MTHDSREPIHLHTETPMDWNKIAPWNWFKHEEEEIRPHRNPAVRARHAADSASDFPADFARVFEEASRRFFTGSLSNTDSLYPLTAPIRPQLDISEGRKAYTVRAELPGIDRGDISIEIEGQDLVLRAEKRQEKEEDEEGYHCVERMYGAVQRVLALPQDADAEGIDARFKNGVLKIRIPKHPALVAPTRKIEIEGT